MVTRAVPVKKYLFAWSVVFLTNRSSKQRQTQHCISSESLAIHQLDEWSSRKSILGFNYISYTL